MAHLRLIYGEATARPAPVLSGAAVSNSAIAVPDHTVVAAPGDAAPYTSPQANGLPHTSPGQRPGFMAPKKPVGALKARFIVECN